MAKKLTLQDAITLPANFLYIWADKSFIAALDRDAQLILRVKKANQQKLILALADGNVDTYKNYLNQIEKSFKEKYQGVSPKEALYILADGGEIAGKDGLYGIGKVLQAGFTSNPSVTVDPNTGVILLNGVAQSCTPVYGKDGQITNQNAVLSDGTYSSLYDKKSGKYYAYQFAPTSGDGKFNASGEKLLLGSMTNSMWQDLLGVISTIGDWILKFVQALVSAFGTTQTTYTPQEYTPITTATTTPNQRDGFIYNQKTSLGILAIAGLTALFLVARRRKKKD